MAEEIDDNGFYREDFSAESDWEIFNAQMCEIFQTWELSTSDDWGREFNAGELFNCKWHVKEENLKYRDKKITITYYKADLKTQDLNTIDKSKAPLHVDLMSRNNTFSPSMTDSLQSKRVVHTLARYYGLRRFVLLQVVDSQGANLNNQSDFGITSFLSSIFVVTAELNWSVPVFLQIFHPTWCYFVGVGMTFNMRTNFDAVSLHDAPERMRYLSGLLKIFKEKVPHSYEKPAIVSVQNIYDLDEIRLKVPMYVPFDLNPLEVRVISLSQFTALPHGYFSDSKSDIYAIFTWPEIAENTAIDSELQTQFTPSKAHYGFVQLMSHATSYLSSCLTDFKRLSESKSALQSYIGRYFSNTAAISELELENHSTKTKLMKMRSAMQQENYYKLYKETEQQSQKKVPGPMTDLVLNQMLYYLFPDMHPEKPLFPYETPQHDPHRIKSAKPDSLVQRLSCLLATCNAHFGGERGLVQIWASFIKELRFLWDNCLPIPGVLKCDTSPLDANLFWLSWASNSTPLNSQKAQF
uniref:Rab3 GTPase-activating protein catalytic subunit n=1 Tax=Glossina morsitans morsitans TaxID=37546 RepID=A0A1B0G648_GLOMM